MLDGLVAEREMKLSSRIRAIILWSSNAVVRKFRFLHILWFVLAFRFASHVSIGA